MIGPLDWPGEPTYAAGIALCLQPNVNEVRLEYDADLAGNYLKYRDTPGIHCFACTWIPEQFDGKKRTYLIQVLFLQLQRAFSETFQTVPGKVNTYKIKTPLLDTALGIVRAVLREFRDMFSCGNALYCWFTLSSASDAFEFNLREPLRIWNSLSREVC